MTCPGPMCEVMSDLKKRKSEYVSFNCEIHERKLKKSRSSVHNRPVIKKKFAGGKEDPLDSPNLK